MDVAVILRGVPLHACLELAGDLEMRLALPVGNRFYVAFSDGTLAEGGYEGGVYRFRIHTEGAGPTAIRREDNHDIIELKGAIEWVTIAADQGGSALGGYQDPLPILPGLFDECGTRMTAAL